MKRKLIIGTVAAIFLGLLAYFVASIFNTLDRKENTAEQMKALPTFTITTTQGVNLDIQETSKKQHTLFVYFNSDCDYCQAKAHQIKEHLDQFHEAQVIFISSESIEQVLSFARDYKLECLDNIHFVKDKTGELANFFDITTVPYMALYNKDGKLISSYKGSSPIKAVIKDINNH